MLYLGPPTKTLWDPTVIVGENVCFVLSAQELPKAQIAFFWTKPKSLVRSTEFGTFAACFHKRSAGWVSEALDKTDRHNFLSFVFANEGPRLHLF